MYKLKVTKEENGVVKNYYYHLNDDNSLTRIKKTQKGGGVKHQSELQENQYTIIGSKTYLKRDGMVKEYDYDDGKEFYRDILIKLPIPVNKKPYEVFAFVDYDKPKTETDLAKEHVLDLLQRSQKEEGVKLRTSDGETYTIIAINEGYSGFFYIFEDSDGNRYNYSSNPLRPIGDFREKVRRVTDAPKTRKEKIASISDGFNFLLSSVQREGLFDVFRDLYEIKNKYNI